MNPRKHGNGVKPIKDSFTASLVGLGWALERRPALFDAELYLDPLGMKFGIEWETGNISSSHRAINTILLATLNGEYIGGVIVVPSVDMYNYVTDRVGNVGELERYFPLWREYGKNRSHGDLAVVVVEHDGTDEAAPLISKGADGRARR